MSLDVSSNKLERSARQAKNAWIHLFLSSHRCAMRLAAKNLQACVIPSKQKVIAPATRPIYEAKSTGLIPGKDMAILLASRVIQPVHCLPSHLVLVDSRQTSTQLAKRSLPGHIIISVQCSSSRQPPNWSRAQFTIY